MLTRLEFDVIFASTGKRFTGNHDLLTGMTAIVGANEKGKSLRIEMIRYALFGTGALRAAMTQYKTLKATLDFIIKDKAYTVHRTKSDAELRAGDEVIAKGTKAVNLAVIRLFGYNMAVFDSANACLQGQVEAMTEMKPAERKAMVDRTIGLHVIDDLIKDVADQMTLLRGRAEGVRSRIVEIEEPILPELYAPVVDVDQAIDTHYKNEKKRGELAAYLAATEGRAAPVKPIQPPLPRTVTVGQDIVAETKHYKELEAQIKFLGEIEEPKDLLTQDEINARAAQLAKWETYSLWESRTPAVPETPFPEEFVERQRLLFDVAEARTLLRHKETECPACHHRWHLDGVDLLKTRAAQLPADDLEEPYFPTVSQLINETKLRHKLHAEYTQHMMNMPEKVEDPKDSHAAIMAETGKLQKAANYLKLQELKTQFARLHDYTDVINALRIYDVEEKAYNREQSLYLKVLEDREKAKVELDAVPVSDTDIELLKTIRTVSATYDNEKAMYDRMSAGVAEAKTMLTTIEHELGQLAAARTGLQELKPKVKAYLVPSLNIAASKLIAEMTGGVRNKVEVTDEFDIIVDNQPVETLSGSGKAVANLAVRIALGTVLTNKVFSVFLGDEIDAAMDKERAAYTAGCIRNLSGTISQIILVSHQQPESDHRIEL